ncbi:DUF3631 domain-containing protein [Radicibacter daui]|uniref:DUF3631 domain-containing protein n=1 Tax=Radicibacter daui TaxID=3064829 RepID=UPI004046A8FC
MKRHHQSIPFADINAAASQIFPELIRQWFPSGRANGNTWRVGNLAGEPGRSLSIIVSGPQCGRWKDFATNQGGADPISLFAAKLGVGQAEGAMQLGQMLGVGGAGGQRFSDSRPPSRSLEKTAVSSSMVDDEQAGRIGKAQALLRDCVPVGGTPASHYLAERAIDPEKLPVAEVGWHQSSGAVLYAARNPNGVLTAVQRVFLDPDGRAQIGVAGRKNKRTNGVLKGSAFTLAGNGSDILICDGPEDALSLWQATGAPVRCAFGMDWGEIPLPESGAVVLVADNDDQDSAADNAVTKAASRLMERGYRVKLTRPPADVKDANDLLRKLGPDAVRSMVAAAEQVPAAELGQEGAPTDLKSEVIRLSKLDPLDYALEQSAAAARFGLKLAVLERLVEAARSRKTSVGGLDLFPVIEPWPSPVPLGELLDDMCDTMRRFIVCDPGVLKAVALWAAFTWLIDKVQVAPLLVITAPEKRCGKSMLLSLLKRLVRRPLPAANITTAATFRALAGWKPTLLIDEADTFLGGNAELRGILNSGQTRDFAYSLRIEGDSRELMAYGTWGAKAIAGIGHLEGTIMDRSIVVELRRKREGEVVEKLRHAEPEDFERLARMLARFAQDAGEMIGAMRPDAPVELNDRAQDNWEPLLAIADHAGGHWPETARAAALQISGKESEALSVSAELLSDIRDIFERLGCDKITTVDLLAALNANETAPWSTYNKGEPLTPRNLAKLLGEYRIRPRNISLKGTSPKGYLTSNFEDAFGRYLPPKAAAAEVASMSPAPKLSDFSSPPGADFTPSLPPPGTPFPPPPTPPPYVAPKSVSSFGAGRRPMPNSGHPQPLAADVSPSAGLKAAESLDPSVIADKSKGTGE